MITMYAPASHVTAEHLRAIAQDLEREAGTGILDIGNVGVFVDDDGSIVIVVHPNIWFRVSREVAEGTSALLQALLMKPRAVTQ